MNFKLSSHLFNGTDCKQDTSANYGFPDVNVSEEREGVRGLRNQGGHAVSYHSSLPFSAAVAAAAAVAEGEGPGHWKTLTAK